MSLRLKTLVGWGLCAALGTGCSARSAQEDGDSTGRGSSGAVAVTNTSSTSAGAVHGSSGADRSSSSSSSSGSEPSSSSGPDLGPDACPDRILPEPRTLSIVNVDPDLGGIEPFPKYGLVAMLCTATDVLEGPGAGTSLFELDCIESMTGKSWRHEVTFYTEWPLALADALIGEQDLRLEYFASWGGFSIGPTYYSLRDADGELLIWARSHAGVCAPIVRGDDDCNLARPLEEPLARPDPFASIVPVDDGCGLRSSWQGDYYPNHSTGYTPPEVVRRHAIQLDDDGGTVIHDGQSAHVTKDGHAFDVYVSSAHVAVTDPGNYASNVSLMIVRAL